MPLFGYNLNMKVRVRVCPKSGHVNVVKSLRPGRTSGNNSVVLDVMANAHNRIDGGGGDGREECDPATGKRKVGRDCSDSCFVPS